MSHCTISVIIGRIKTASKGSPIAVFKLPNPDGKYLNAVFGNTVRTIKMVDTFSNMFIGEFHNGMNMSDVRKELESAARG